MLYKFTIPETTSSNDRYDIFRKLFARGYTFGADLKINSTEKLEEDYSAFLTSGRYTVCFFGFAECRKVMETVNIYEPETFPSIEIIIDEEGNTNRFDVTDFGEMSLEEVLVMDI